MRLIEPTFAPYNRAVNRDPLNLGNIVVYRCDMTRHDTIDVLQLPPFEQK